MNYFISYDIQGDKLRSKIAKFLLRNACERIQKSVFLAPNYSTKEFNLFLDALTLLLKNNIQEKDTLLIFPSQRQQLVSAISFGDKTSLDAFLADEFYFLV